MTASKLLKAYRRGGVLRIGMGRTDLMIVEKVLLDFKQPHVNKRRKYIGHHFKGNLVARYHCEVARASTEDKILWAEEHQVGEF